MYLIFDLYKIFIVYRKGIMIYKLKSLNYFERYLDKYMELVLSLDK